MARSETRGHLRTRLKKVPKLEVVARKSALELEALLSINFEMGETMADDMTHRGPQDRSQINLSEDYEVQYCTDKLELSKTQLEHALREVGASADAVETELRWSTLASGLKQ